MVIERKSIVWPPEDYLSNHRNEHRLSEHFSEALWSHGDAFSKSLYQLSVRDTSLHGRTYRDVAAIARSIAGVIASHTDEARSDGGLTRLSPIPWNFRPLREWERDESTPTRGIRVVIVGSTEDQNYAEFCRKQAAAIDGFCEEFERQVRAASRKFSDYSDCLRLLLVQFFGDIEFGPTDEEIRAIVIGSQLLKDINQVWVADKNWISEDDYELEWVRIT